MIRFNLAHPVMPKQADRSQVMASKVARGMTVGEALKHHALFVHHYQPADLRENAQALTLMMRMCAPPEPITGPVKITLTFLVPWRTSELKRDKDRGVACAYTKPDWDNLSKQVCDAMEAAGFFANDSQIACVTVYKARTHVDVVDTKIDVQGVHIMVEPASDDELLAHFEKHIWEPGAPDNEHDD